MTVELYQAGDGWRWRIIAANGEPIASGEAYTRRIDMMTTLALIFGARRLAGLIAHGRVKGLVQ